MPPPALPRCASEHAGAASKRSSASRATRLRWGAEAAEATFREVVAQGPEKTLGRGFAVVHSATGQIITSAAAAGDAKELQAAVPGRIDRGLGAPGQGEAMSEMKTFKEAYAILQKHAQTLRSQQEPDIDNLTTIVSESLAAHKVCKERIDAVEKALEQALGNAQIEGGTEDTAQRRVAGLFSTRRRQERRHPVLIGLRVPVAMLQRPFESPPRRVFGRRAAKRVSQRYAQAHVRVRRAAQSRSWGSGAVRTRSPSMASDADRLSQWLRQGLDAPHRRRCAADALQLLDPRPRSRSLTLAIGDEGVQLGAGELGDVGADRLPGERWTLHHLQCCCRPCV